MKVSLRAAFATAVFGGVSSVFAGPIGIGNIVVYRVGAGGADTLVNTGSPVFVDEFTPGGAPVQSIPLPTTVSGAQRRLIASGTATSEGFLTVSPNSQFLAITGYDAAIPTTGLAGSAAPRSIGIINTTTGAVDTSTAPSDFAAGNNPRSAVTTNGSDILDDWRPSGVRYATLGTTATSTQLSTTVANLRQVNVFDGQLYGSSSSGSAIRLGAVGTGTPTTSGQTITNLPGLPTSTGSPYAYFLADLDTGVAGVDTLYLADDGAGALTKYSLVGGTWTVNGTIGVAADAYRGVTGIVNGTTVQLFATRKGGSTAAGGGELVALTDSSGYNGAFSGTPSLLAIAATNTAFRGVGVIVPEPGAIGALAISGALLAQRRRTVKFGQRYRFVEKP